MLFFRSSPILCDCYFQALGKSILTTSRSPPSPKEGGSGRRSWMSSLVSSEHTQQRSMKDASGLAPSQSTTRESTLTIDSNITTYLLTSFTGKTLPSNLYKLSSTSMIFILFKITQYVVHLIFISHNCYVQYSYRLNKYLVSLCKINSYFLLTSSQTI